MAINLAFLYEELEIWDRSDEKSQEVLTGALSFALCCSWMYSVGARTRSPVTAHVPFEGKCFRSSLRKTIKIVTCYYHYSSVDFQVASKASSNHQSHRPDKKPKAGRRKEARLKRLKEPQELHPKAVHACNYPSRSLLFLNLPNHTMNNDWSIGHSWSFCRLFMLSSCVLCAHFGNPARDIAFVYC